MNNIKKRGPDPSRYLNQIPDGLEGNRTPVQKTRSLFFYERSLFFINSLRRPEADILAVLVASFYAHALKALGMSFPALFETRPLTRR